MNIKNKFIFLAITATCVLALTSCHDDIYGRINQEVTLETNGITGSINSLIQFNNYIYTQNGNVYRKPNTSSASSGLYNEQWTKVIDNTSSEFSGQHFEFLASDSNYIYGLALTWNTITNSGEPTIATKTIYYSDDITNGTTWKALPQATLQTLLGSTDTTGVTDIKTLFCNRAFDTANRHAYVRLYSTTDAASHVYMLNGGNAPTLVRDGTNNAGASSVQAAYLNGVDYFNNSHAFTSNGTYLFYSSSSSSVYCANGWDSTNGFTLNSSTPTSIDYDHGTIYDIGLTADYILIGTSEGIAHAPLSSGKPLSSTVDFSNNAASVLSSSYYVFNILVLEPTKNEYDTDIYGTAEHYGSFSSSTSALFDDIGLWAYYPGRGTWNRDGTADDSTKGN